MRFEGGCHLTPNHPSGAVTCKYDICEGELPFSPSACPHSTVPTGLWWAVPSVGENNGPSQMSSSWSQNLGIGDSHAKGSLQT